MADWITCLFLVLGCGAMLYLLIVYVSFVLMLVFKTIRWLAEMLDF